MTEIPTRNEFDELAGDAICAGSNMASAVECGLGMLAALDKASEAQDALLAAFDTLSARIAELEHIAELDSATPEQLALDSRIASRHSLNRERGYDEKD